MEDEGKPRPSRAGLEIVEDAPASRQASLTVDESSRSGKAALVVDEHTAAGPSRAGLVIDEPGTARAETALGEPLKLIDEEPIRQAARGLPSLAAVLGIVDRDLETVTDAEVRGQARRFRERWVELEKRRAVLQRIKTHEQVAPWLFVIDVIAGRSEAVAFAVGGAWAPILQDLPRLGPKEALQRTMAHQRSQRMGELVASARAFVVVDKILQWNERLDLVEIATSLGFGEREIAEAMKRLEHELGTSIARESEAEWKARLPKGEWEPHETLGGGDEGWDLGRLRAALVDPARFDEATVVARGLNDATALKTYLKYQRGGKPYVPVAIEAESRASAFDCPALAVWWFVWSTGQPIELHVTGEGHRPAGDPGRRASTLAELRTLIVRSWLIDDLGCAFRDGLLAGWLEHFDRDVASRVTAIRDHWRREVDTGTGGDRRASRRRAVIESLWASGFRGFPLRTDDGQCTIANELRDVISAYPECAKFLEESLATGLLEIWLMGLGDRELARTTSAIRTDAHGLKLYRWLQAAGYPHYDVGGERVDSVQAFADLPKRGVGFAVIWEHIREGVPQARFARNPDIVATLDGVRAERDLHEAARGLIACFRLGLRELPVRVGDRVRWIAQPAELADVLTAHGGRAELDVLLRSQILETWLETIAPGSRRVVAVARGLPPAIAVDRALRPWLRDVFPAPGLRAATYQALQALALEDVIRLCRDREARLRIIDALSVMPIAGTQPLRPDPALDSAVEDARAAMEFAWRTLRVPILLVGATKVTSTEGLHAVLATSSGRDAARVLARSGVLVAWAIEGLGLDLAPAFRENDGCVRSKLFPALCIELGEQPTRVSMRSSPRSATLSEGRTLSVEVSLTNEDPVREATVFLDMRMSRAIGTFHSPDSTDQDAQRAAIRLGPSETAARTLAFVSTAGQSGQTKLEVSVAHVHPTTPRPIDFAAVDVTVRFPWRDVIWPAVVWLLVGTAVMGLFRATLAGADVVLLAPRGPIWNGYDVSGVGIWGLGMLVTLVLGGAALIFWVSKRRQVTGARTDPASSLGEHWVWIIGGGLLLVIASIYGIGYLVLIISEGIDLIGLRLHPSAAVEALRTHDARRLVSLAVWGWLLVGATLGLACGLALGFRSINRRWIGEALRGVLLLWLIVLAVWGAP